MKANDVRFYTIAVLGILFFIGMAAEMPGSTMTQFTTVKTISAAGLLGTVMAGRRLARSGKL